MLECLPEASLATFARLAQEDGVTAEQLIAALLYRSGELAVHSSCCVCEGTGRQLPRMVESRESTSASIKPALLCFSEKERSRP